MAPRMRNRNVRLANRFERIVRVNQQHQLPVLLIREPVPHCFEIPLQFRDVGADTPLRMPRPRLAPIEIRLISRILDYSSEDGLVIDRALPPFLLEAPRFHLSRPRGASTAS